jgi:hypothetical protein
VTVFVQHQVAHDELCAAVHGRDTGAPQEGAQAQYHLFDAERLGDVVVAARRQPGDAVFHGILGRQKQNRQLRVFFAQLVQDVETAHVGQHHVEDDDIGPVRPGRRDR